MLTYVSRLEALASWEEEPHSPGAQSHPLSTHEEMLHVITVLAAHI